VSRMGRCPGHGLPAPCAIIRSLSGFCREGRYLLSLFAGGTSILAPDSQNRNSPDGTGFWEFWAVLPECVRLAPQRTV
jgi:hypothetical protein